LVSWKIIFFFVVHAFLNSFALFLNVLILEREKGRIAQIESALKIQVCKQHVVEQTSGFSKKGAAHHGTAGAFYVFHSASLRSCVSNVLK
jgi:hypothetical protein